MDGCSEQENKPILAVVKQTKEIEFGFHHYSKYGIGGCLENFDLTVLSEEEIKFSLKLNHHNHLRLIFPVEDLKMCMYEKMDMYLDQYIDYLAEAFGIFPIMESEDTKSLYIPEQFRYLFRSMVSFISFVHQQKFCMGPIGIENLVMRDGYLKFWKVEFRTLLDGDEGARQKKENYSAIAKIIKVIIEQRVNSLNRAEEHIQYLYRFLTRLEKATGDMSLMSDHLAVISFREILNFIVELKEKGFFLCENAFVLIMQRKYHITKPFEQIIGGDNPWSHFVEEGRYDKISTKIGNKYIPFEYNSNILRCARNAVTHLQETHYARQVVDDNYIGIVIMDCFGEMLSAVQEAMMDMIITGMNYPSRPEYIGRCFLSLLKYINDDWQEVRATRIGDF